MVRAQMCPVCKKGPFVALPQHAQKAHKIDKWELRNMAGLSSSDSICSDEHIQKCREIALRKAQISGFQLPQKSGKHANQTIAGRKRLAETLSRFNASMTPQQRKERASAAALSKTEECRRAAKEKARLTRATPEYRKKQSLLSKRPEVIEALRDGLRRFRESNPPQGCGTVAAYKRGCRCDSCKRAKAAHRADRARVRKPIADAKGATNHKGETNG